MSFITELYRFPNPAIAKAAKPNLISLRKKFQTDTFYTQGNGLVDKYFQFKSQFERKYVIKPKKVDFKGDKGRHRCWI